MLVPHLRAGNIIIMDNARVHRRPVLHHLFGLIGMHVVFLPPYSPGEV